jgi:hypothetical protein
MKMPIASRMEIASKRTHCYANLLWMKCEDEMIKSAGKGIIRKEYYLLYQHSAGRKERGGKVRLPQNSRTTGWSNPEFKKRRKWRVAWTQSRKLFPKQVISEVNKILGMSTCMYVCTYAYVCMYASGWPSFLQSFKSRSSEESPSHPTSLRYNAYFPFQRTYRSCVITYTFYVLSCYPPQTPQAIGQSILTCPLIIQQTTVNLHVLWPSPPSDNLSPRRDVASALQENLCFLVTTLALTVLCI